MQKFLILKFHVCLCRCLFCLCCSPVGFQLVAAVALPDFPRPIPCATFCKFLRLVCALHAGIVLFHLMYFVVDEQARFLRRTGKRVFVLLPAVHGLFPFFKA